MLSQPADPAILRRLSRGRWLRALAFFIVIRICRVVARLVFGFRVTGVEHLPRSGAVIICPNHQSYLDGFLVAGALPFSLLRRIFLVGAAEYFQTPMARFVAAMANIVPVDPDANLVGAMQVCATGLRSGQVLVLFPEGERTIDGELKPFRKGATILSSHLSVPIAPTALDGLYELWPRSRPFRWSALLPWRSPRISLAFGAPLHASSDDPAPLRDAVEGLRRGLRPEA